MDLQSGSIEAANKRDILIQYLSSFGEVYVNDVHLYQEGLYYIAFMLSMKGHSFDMICETIKILLEYNRNYNKNFELKEIIRRTGRKPIECKCAKCRSQCFQTPCLGTPYDIVKLLLNGYHESLIHTVWAVGMVVGSGIPPVEMIQLEQGKSGCVLFKDGLCPLHDLGLKPTEGRLSSHEIKADNFNFRKSLAYNVAKEWLKDSNKDIVRLLMTLYR